MSVIAETRRGKVPLRSLSYGYRSSLTWVMDLAGRMFDLFGPEDPFNQSVVILVDEIDLHLHPKWQKQLIQTLDKAFPKAQFIVTAHSPLIVQAAPDANVALLKWEGDQVVIRNDLDYVRDWRVDQILASELFEEQPVHSKKVQDVLDQRQALISKPERSVDEERQLEQLDSEIGLLPTAAVPVDPRVMDVLKRIMGDQGKESPAA
jgi:predicted ATP-binding protein involved in virulence